MIDTRALATDKNNFNPENKLAGSDDDSSDTDESDTDDGEQRELDAEYEETVGDFNNSFDSVDELNEEVKDGIPKGGLEFAKDKGQTRRISVQLK